MQLDHYQNKFQKRQFPITLICDNIYFQQNIGSLFRVSEAFGVEQIIFLGKDIPLNPRKINKTSRSTHLHIPNQMFEESITLIDYLQQNQYEIIAIEITSSSKPLKDIKISGDKKLAVVVGSEINGICEEILAISHQVSHIEMYGTNSSMNVVQATSIALYEITNKIA